MVFCQTSSGGVMEKPNPYLDFFSDVLHWILYHHTLIGEVLFLYWWYLNYRKHYNGWEISMVGEGLGSGRVCQKTILWHFFNPSLKCFKKIKMLKYGLWHYRCRGPTQNQFLIVILLNHCFHCILNVRCLISWVNQN